MVKCTMRKRNLLTIILKTSLRYGRKPSLNAIWNSDNTNSLYSGSNKKEYAEQNKMIEALSEEINKENPGVKAVRGALLIFQVLPFQYQRERKRIISVFCGWRIFYIWNTDKLIQLFLHHCNWRNDRQVTLGCVRLKSIPNTCLAKQKCLCSIHNSSWVLTITIALVCNFFISSNPCLIPNIVKF